MPQRTALVEVQWPVGGAPTDRVMTCVYRRQILFDSKSFSQSEISKMALDELPKEAVHQEDCEWTLFCDGIEIVDDVHVVIVGGRRPKLTIVGRLKSPAGKPKQRLLKRPKCVIL